MKIYLHENSSKVGEHVYVYRKCIYVCVCLNARISLFDNIKNYNYLLVFLLQSGDLAKEAQSNQEEKKSYLALLELRTVLLNFQSQRRKKNNFYFHSKYINSLIKVGFCFCKLGKKRKKT